MLVLAGEQTSHKVNTIFAVVVLFNVGISVKKKFSCTLQ